MQFNKGKILHLGKNKLVHQYKVGAVQLGSTLAKKDLVDAQLDVNQQCPCSKGSRRAPFGTGVSAAQGGDPSTALGTGEATPGILC